MNNPSYRRHNPDGKWRVCDPTRDSLLLRELREESRTDLDRDGLPAATQRGRGIFD